MKPYETFKEFGVDLTRKYLAKFPLKLYNNIINSRFIFNTTRFPNTVSYKRQIKMRGIVRITASTSDQILEEGVSFSNILFNVTPVFATSVGFI